MLSGYISLSQQPLHSRMFICFRNTFTFICFRNTCAVDLNLIADQTHEFVSEKKTLYKTTTLKAESLKNEMETYDKFACKIEMEGKEQVKPLSLRTDEQVEIHEKPYSCAMQPSKDQLISRCTKGLTPARSLSNVLNVIKPLLIQVILRNT